MAVVVAQLVEQSLLTPELNSSNLDIGKSLSTNCLIEKTKIKKKRPGRSIFKKPAETVFFEDPSKISQIEFSS